MMQENRLNMVVAKSRGAAVITTVAMVISVSLLYLHTNRNEYPEEHAGGGSHHWVMTPNREAMALPDLPAVPFNVTSNNANAKWIGASVTNSNKAACTKLVGDGGRPTSEVWKCWLREITGSPETNIFCDNLYQPYTQESFFVDEYQQHLKALNNLMEQSKRGEGHSAQFWRSGALFYDLARMPLVRQICQIGFNGGHSTLSLLSGNPHSKVLSFDIGRWTYTEKAGAYLDKVFPGRHTLILGSSEETVPKYLKEHPEIKGACDYVIVDGGHSFKLAYGDLINMKEFSHPGTLVVFDDMGHILQYNKDVHDAYAKMYYTVNISEMFHCSNGMHHKKVHPIHPGRGVVLFKYLWN